MVFNLASVVDGRTVSLRDVIDTCNNRDDDCDGSIDEDGDQIDRSESAATDGCPMTWEPVCSTFGLVPNACFLACYGLAEKPIETCVEVGAQTRRCVTDRDCFVSECEGGSGICGGVTERGCAEYSSLGQCYERFGTCGCDQNTRTCSFVPNEEVDACLMKRGCPCRSDDDAD